MATHLKQSVDPEKVEIINLCKLLYLDVTIL